MEAPSVRFALLAVTRSAAELQVAASRAIEAGHQVVAQAAVPDTEDGLASQLGGYLDDGNIEVVLILAGADSDAATRALKPLVTEVLPGFTDLFRWMMFQEAGASAMHSAAEAAIAGGKIVFVLPGAIEAAMDKLILPQFDPATARNLVEKLPRMRTEPGMEGVPQQIEAERTQGGSGVSARLPAPPSGRMRSRTGANVVHREKPTDEATKQIDLRKLENDIASSRRDDEKTKLVPASSVLPPDAYNPAAEDDHTDVLLAAPPAPKIDMPAGTLPSLVKPTTTAKKPGIPRVAVPASVPPTNVRGKALTPATPLPSVTIQPRARKSDPPVEPSKWGGDPGKSIDAQRAADAAKSAEARKRALTPKPIDLPKPVDPPTTKIPAPAAAAIAAASTAPAATDAPISHDSPTVAYPRSDTILDEAPTTTRPRTEPTFPAPVPAPARPPAPAPAAPAKAAAKPRTDEWQTERPRASEPPATVAAKPDAFIEGNTNVLLRPSDRAIPTGKPSDRPTPLPAASKAAANDAVAAKPVAPPKPVPRANGVAVHTPANDLDDAKTVDASAPVKPVAAAAAAAAEAKPAPAKRPTDSLEAIDPSELIEETTPPPGPAPAPKPPVVAKPLEGPPVTQSKLRSHPPTEKVEKPLPSPRSTGELPRGTFSYPVQKKKSSLVLTLVLGLVVLAVGFGAVLFVFRDKGNAGDTTAKPVDQPNVAAGTAADATASADAAAAVASVEPDAMPVAEPIDAAEPAIDLDPPPPGPGSAAKPIGGAKPRGGTKPTGGAKPAGGATTPAGAGSGATVTAGAGSNEGATTPAVDDDCDETSCVLSKYDRACCAKYKPAEKPQTDFAPRVGDVPETLDKSMVRAGVERVKPRVVSCGEKSGAKGTVKIALTVAPEGNVTAASVADSPDAALGDCVLAAMRSAKFGKTVNGSSFTYPFAF